jgi:hypothetical protein
LIRFSQDEYTFGAKGDQKIASQEAVDTITKHGLAAFLDPKISNMVKKQFVEAQNTVEEVVEKKDSPAKKYFISDFDVDVYQNHNIKPAQEAK